MVSILRLFLLVIAFAETRSNRCAQTLNTVLCRVATAIAFFCVFREFSKVGLRNVDFISGEFFGNFSSSM